jgi:hypothetical protein
LTTIKIITATKDEFIEIQLADTPEAQIWLDHMSAQCKTGTLRSVRMPSKVPLNSVDYLPIWENIKKNIRQIETQFNIKWPESIPEYFPILGSEFIPFDRQMLNRFHRYFAQGTMFFNRWQIDSPTTFEPIPENGRAEFVRLLEEINTWIHQIEKYCDSINNSEYKGKISKLELKFDELVWRGYSWEKFYNHGANPEYNVCISMEVHGKNYLQAFLDDDDPSQVDVHGQRGMFGCLDIYLDDTVFKILESDKFKTWLGTNNIKDTGLVQIVKVTNSSRPLKNIISTRIATFTIETTE